MDYSTYSVTDFVLDEVFQQWAKNPGAVNPVPWESWLATNPQQKEIIDQARMLVLSIDFQKTHPSEINGQQLWQKIQTGIRDPTPVIERPVKDDSVRIGWFRYWQRTAAVVATLLILGAVALYFLPGRRTIAHTTAYGDSQVIRLPDGSEVTLNANSSLRYSSKWEASRVREVWLEGEAFFRIVKKSNAKSSPSARFLVHTQDLNIEVLGTEFDVKNRRGHTRVVLNSGKVSLRRNRTEGAADLIMEPKDLVEYSPTNRQLVKRRVNPEQYAAWVNQRMVFSETPLFEIAQTLEDNYGLKVTFANERLAQRKFTGSVTTDNIDLLLTSIQESFRIKVIRQGDQIRMEP